MTKEESNSELTFLESYMKSPLGTRVAGILFLFAKMSGLVALPTAFAGHGKVAMIILVVAGLCLFVSMVLCIKDMNAQTRLDDKQSSTEDEIIERLLKEGRLNERIKQARNKLAAQT